MKKSLLALLIFATPAAAQLVSDLNQKRGIDPNSAYAMSAVDAVSTFSGNLTVRIPIGLEYPLRPNFSYQLMLTYNSKIWDFMLFEEVGGAGYDRFPVPEMLSNAGLGWRLSLGALQPPNLSVLAEGKHGWTYVAPDGSAYEFDNYDLNPVEIQSKNGYLRLKTIAGQRQIEFPDGTRQLFTSDNKLVEINDRFGNWVRISYGTRLWVITDGHGGNTTRTHRVYFHDYNTFFNQSNLKEPVWKVEVAGPAGSTSTYEFSYGQSPQTILNVQYCDETGVDPSYRTVPLLREIALPDGTKYVPSYNDTGQHGCAAGTLKDLRLPTLGHLAWTYNSYQLPLPQCQWNDGIAMFSRSYPGVAVRKLLSDTAEIGQWTYTATLLNQVVDPYPYVDCGPYRLRWPAPEELRTIVTAPDGSSTTHFYSAHPSGAAEGSNQHKEEYGLPLTRIGPRTGDTFINPVGGRFISAIQSAPNGGGAERTTYLNYEGDQGTEEDPPLRDARVSGVRTVFNTDSGCGGPCFTDVAHSDYDSAGHYRTSISTSNFPGTMTRTATTTYTPDISSWLLNLYTSSSVTEGSSTAKSLFCFEPATGFLLRTRAFSSLNGVLSSNDLLTINGRDERGNKTSEEYFGGDSPGQALNTTDPLCSMAAPVAEFRIDRTYNYGSLQRSQYNGATFYSFDADIDANTGLVSASRDTAGVVTTYNYDSMGRQTWVKPTGRAWTEYRYLRAGDEDSDESPPLVISYGRVTVYQRQNAQEFGFVRSKTKFDFDSLGRLQKETNYLPNDTADPPDRIAAVRRITAYDEMGRTKYTTEQTVSPSESNSTRLSYDALGRPAQIIASDETVTTFSYQGSRRVERTVQVGKNFSAPSTITLTAVTTAEIYDGFGRLAEVSEKGDTLDETTLELTPYDITTTYTYDVAGRLNSVGMSAQLNTQQRFFTYDGRGFLQTETHPESGVTNYTKYDARGHLLEKRHPSAPGYDLNFTYDLAERLIRVDSRHPQTGLWVPSKEFTFATANEEPSLVKGKLRKATRYNYLPPNTYIIDDWYRYQDAAGRLTHKTTEITWDDGYFPILVKGFTHKYSYSDLDGIERITYPYCVSGGSCGGNGYWGELRQSYFPAASGHLKSISAIPYAKDFIVDRDYWPNGTVAVTRHGNGVVDSTEYDANSMPRPRGLRVEGFDGGCIAYFADVPCSHPLFAYIDAMYRNQVTAGCAGPPTPQYCPDSPTTRAQMAVFILKSKYGPSYTPPPATGTIFADVPLGSFAAAWIEELYRQGITSGCGVNPLRYCPTDSPTRKQMAAFLLAAKYGPAFQFPAATGIFIDVPVNDPFARVIEALYREGIDDGCGLQMFCPDTVVTRGGMAPLLTKTFNLQ